MMFKKAKIIIGLCNQKAFTVTANSPQPLWKNNISNELTTPHQYFSQGRA